MGEHFRPQTADQVRDAVAWAVSQEAPLEVMGQGSKRGMGRPTLVDHTLDLSGLTGIGLYQPEELVLTASPGTPLADIEAALAQSRQQLAFEPPDLGPLLGGAEEQGTIGGVIACNLAGPRRLQAGAARDHFLGFEAVSGRGEAFKSGGRVVKNVTGYDLSKLMAGSFGTLAVLTSVTVKVLPVPEKIRTVLVQGPNFDAAGKAMTEAVTSPFDVSGAAYLPADLAAASGVGRVKDAGAAVAAIRLEGPADSVAYRTEKLRELLSAYGSTDELHSQDSKAFWPYVRDVRPFVGDDRPVWKLALPPALGAIVADALAVQTGGEAFLDWAGGLVWLALPAGGDVMADQVREAAAAHGGQATLVRAPDAVRATVPVFPPQADGIAALGRRIKANFDPKGVLNPGRMADGV